MLLNISDVHFMYVLNMSFCGHLNNIPSYFKVAHVYSFKDTTSVYRNIKILGISTEEVQLWRIVILFTSETT